MENMDKLTDQDIINIFCSYNPAFKRSVSVPKKINLIKKKGSFIPHASDIKTGVKPVVYTQE